MAAPLELDGARLIGLVVSKNLYRGGDMGYCLLITRDAIIGAKKPESLEEFEAYPGLGGSPEAKVIAQELIRVKAFSVPTSSIGQILFKKPGMFNGGYVIIKTATSAIRVDMTVVSTNSPRLPETAKRLREALWTVVGERLVDVGQKGNS